MKNLFKFTTIVLLLLTLIGLLLVFALVYVFYSNKGASMEFQNASRQVVESAEIAVSDKSCLVSGLVPGGKFRCYFENLSDSSYSVSVKLKDGQLYTKESLGYLSGGFDFYHVIRIYQSGDIELVSNPRT